MGEAFQCVLPVPSVCIKLVFLLFARERLHIGIFTWMKVRLTMNVNARRQRWGWEEITPACTSAISRHAFVDRGRGPGRQGRGLQSRLSAVADWLTGFLSVSGLI